MHISKKIKNFVAGHVQLISACIFYVTNKCPFPIWPATASNTGHPVIAGGGFHLPSGRTQKFSAPGDWSGRIWARTGCNFNATNHQPACETGDCAGKLECAGSTGLPPATLVEFALQVDKWKPSFYDVSIVDGYNLPVAVATRPSDARCRIGGCVSDLKAACPAALQFNQTGVVVACKSACLAFDLDRFCCRNEYGSPATCPPNEYSKLFKKACPAYSTYAFDAPSALVNCPSAEYVVTFCPAGVGGGVAAD